MRMDQLTCIDLFCGCGGFSLGMQRAGFRIVAAIDFNEEAVGTFKVNFPATLCLRKDLKKFSPNRLIEKLGVNHVDVIVGGPPCQGFSNIRQGESANHGSRVRKDKRRWLYKSYLDYVAAFRPKVFVMENVMGIQSAAKGKFFTLVQSDARKLGYRVHAQVEEAWKLGVPQKRRRQLIIGVRNEIPGYFSSDLIPAKRASAMTVLWDAIGDLPAVTAGSGSETCDYDLSRRNTFLSDRSERASNYLKKVVEIDRNSTLTAHRARPHSERDLRDFARMREGETAAQAIARGEKMEFPYNRKIFLDRYTRQHREGFCSTIVAHLAKDGLMFIHPTQRRSLTPREAARVQSFPDWFQFPVARTHQFRLIGNAVPPLVAEAIAEELKIFLGASAVKEIQFGIEPLPVNETEAVEWLRPLLDQSPRMLRQTDANIFKHAWFSIAFLYAGLHPDAALDHGEKTSRVSAEDYPPVSKLEPRLLAPYYERSGWPVVLAPIAREAWRRYRESKLTDEEFYCSEAQRAGMCHRDPLLAEDLRNQQRKTHEFGISST
jgi:DNA (cytosine-5)-methyltransferase 1